MLGRGVGFFFETVGGEEVCLGVVCGDVFRKEVVALINNEVLIGSGFGGEEEKGVYLEGYEGSLFVIIKLGRGG